MKATEENDWLFLNIPEAEVQGFAMFWYLPLPEGPERRGSIGCGGEVLLSSFQGVSVSIFYQIKKGVSWLL